MVIGSNMPLLYTGLPTEVLRSQDYIVPDATIERDFSGNVLSNVTNQGNVTIYNSTPTYRES